MELALLVKVRIRIRLKIFFEDQKVMNQVQIQIFNWLQHSCHHYVYVQKLPPFKKIIPCLCDSVHFQPIFIVITITIYFKIINIAVQGHKQTFALFYQCLTSVSPVFYQCFTSLQWKIWQYQQTIIFKSWTSLFYVESPLMFFFKQK